MPDIGVQIDVFDEQRECDESQSLQGPDGINLNSHLDVFYAILRQVSRAAFEVVPNCTANPHIMNNNLASAVGDDESRR